MARNPMARKNTLIRIGLGLCCLFVMFGTSCRKDTESECPKCPVVLSLVPDAAYFFDTVKIVGRYLLPNDAYGDKLEIRFNGS